MPRRPPPLPPGSTGKLRPLDEEDTYADPAVPAAPPAADDERIQATLVDPVSPLAVDLNDVEKTQITLDLPELSELPLPEAPPSEHAPISLNRIVVVPPPPAAPPPLPAAARAARPSKPPEPGTPAAEIVQLEVQARRSAPREATTLYARAARLIETTSPDRARAIAAYRRIYEIDDSNVPALEALARLSADADDWQASAAYRARLAGLATTPREAARAHLAVGDLLSADERDLAGARLHYERAAALDPKNEAAWRALHQAADADDDDERRVQVHERRAEYEDDASERALLYVQVGKKWAELGQTSDALAAYEKALAADPTNEAAAAVLVGEYASAERWSVAQPLIDMLAAAARRGGDHERALQYLRLGGRAARALGDRQKAVDAALALFEVRPQSESVREELLEAVYLARDDVPLVTRARAALVQLSSAENLSTTALLTLAELRGVLEEWRPMADLLARAVKLETVPARRAQALLSRGRLLEKQMGDLEGAMVAYDEVLRLDPVQTEAMQAIERICTARGDRTTEEQILQRTLDKLPDGERELRHAIMQRLGRLYRDDGQGGQAIDMFRAASRLEPQNPVDRAAIEDLFLASDQLELAVDRVLTEIGRAPLVARGYTELYTLYLRQNAYDKAWCVLDVLADLGALDEEERRFYDDYPPLAPKDVPGQLTGAAWRSHLVPAQLDAQLTTILQIVAAGYLRALVAHVPADARQATFGPLFTRDTSRSAAEVVSTVKNGAEVLALSPPALHVRRGSAVPGALAPVLAPGQGLYIDPEAVEEVSLGELPFVTGRRLAELRPELVARAVFSGVPELKMALGLGIALSRGAPFPANAAKPQLANVGTNLSREEHDRLRAAITDTTQAARLDVALWSQLVDESLSRAGLLLAGRVGLARRGLQREAVLAGDPSAETRTKGLYAFAIGDTYGELRAALGIGVNVPSSVG